jgi:hypothetical protein
VRKHVSEMRDPAGDGDGSARDAGSGGRGAPRGIRSGVACGAGDFEGPGGCPAGLALVPASATQALARGDGRVLLHQ